MDAKRYDRLVADAARRPTRRTALRILAGGLAGALLPGRAARAFQRLDRDGDGLVDDDEQAVYGTIPDVFDSDGDGSGDGEEVYLGTDPLTPGGPAQRSDRDGDGLYDDDEVNIYATSPDIYDTDGDGVGDGEEVYLGRNPLYPENSGPAGPTGPIGATGPTGPIPGTAFIPVVTGKAIE